MIYTYQNLYDDLDRICHYKATVLKDARKTINDSVRDVYSDIDLRSAKRKAFITPNLFNEVFTYAAPTDLKSNAIIDVIPQGFFRDKDNNLRLTTEEEFDRRKNGDELLVALSQYDSIKALKISMPGLLDNDEILISELDSLTSGGGTWTAYGDAENLAANLQDFIRGSGSLEFEISSAGGTTAGIYNTALTVFDITDYRTTGSIFIWVKIADITDITNYILDIGNDTSNYFRITVTTTNEGTAFTNGWNLLRFDLSSAVEVGTVDLENCDFARIFMTKDAGKVSETGYMFDWMSLQIGKIHSVMYYTKYAWQSAAGVYKENSTADDDYINAESDEYTLILNKMGERGNQELREYNDVNYFIQKHKTDKKDYTTKNPSERKVLINVIYDF